MNSAKLIAVGVAILMLLLSLPARVVDADLYTVHLPAISDNRPCTPLAPTPFGVQIYWDTGKTSPYYPFLLESGARWVRTSIDWKKVEPVNVTPNRYDWSHPDRAVGAVRDACLHLIVTHGDDPAWAVTGTGAPLEAFGMAELAEYMGALVERYDGDGIQDAPGSPIVRHWEMYNEPDDTVALYGGRWGHAGVEYAEMLAVVYPAIKAADPQAQVLFGGIAHDWYGDDPSPFFFGFLDDVLAAGGGAYFDIMNFHTYPPFATNWAMQGPGLYEKTHYMRTKLARYGLDKPIFITETADHSNPGWPGVEGSDEMQMRYVAQLYTQALAAGVEVLVWFSLADPGGQYPFDSGLVTHHVPVQPKPAFAVYQTVAAQLGGTRFVRKLAIAETGNGAMEAYQFVDNGRAVVITVAWLDPVESSETAILSLPADQAIVRDIVCAATIIHDTDDGSRDEHVSVQVSGRPVYVTTVQKPEFAAQTPPTPGVAPCR